MSANPSSVTPTQGFYVASGTLRPDAPSYVERQADTDLYQALQHGELCYILTSRQMGKSSLMARTAARLRAENIAVAILDLAAIGQNLTVEQWYDGLLGQLGRHLDLEDELEEYWLDHERQSPLQRWMGALREVVLPRLGDRRPTTNDQRRPTTDHRSMPVEPAGADAARTAPSALVVRRSSLVVFIDEIDAVRSLPFSTDEFFAAIREAYNLRVEDSRFEEITFCLLGVASPSDLIQDPRTTPFNIGRRIELIDFTEAEAAPLAEGLSHHGDTETRRGGKRESQALLERILYWTGGHPYLTQRLCQAVAADLSGPTPDAQHPTPALVDRLCHELFLAARARERDDNLLFVREWLLKSSADTAGLLDRYEQVRSGRQVRPDDTDPLLDVLRLSGAVRLSGDRLVVRNRIYERVFDRDWVVQHMPDAELRRQRAAFRRGLMRATGVAFAVVAVVAGLALVAVNQANVAKRQRRTALSGQKTLRRQLYVAQMNVAQQAWSNGNVDQARELLEAQQPRAGQEDLRGFEWSFLWRLVRQQDALPSPPGLPIRSGPTSVAPAFSPDGKLLAIMGPDGTIRLWDRVARRQTAALPVVQGPDIGYQLVFLPDSRTLLTAANSANGATLKLWDVARHRERVSFTWRGFGIQLSEDGRTITLARGKTVKLWDVAARREIASLTGPADWLIGVRALSPDRTTLAMPTESNTVELWDVATKRRVAAFRGHTAWIAILRFSPDGKILASSGDDTTVKLWNVAAKQAIATLRGHRSAVYSMVFSPDGRTLATSGLDRMVKLWDVPAREEVATLRGFDSWVRPQAFSPDGKTLITTSWDGAYQFCDAARRDRDTLRGPGGGVGSAAFSPDGKTLATGGKEGLRLWDLPSERELTGFPRIPGGRNGIWSMALSPDGKTLATTARADLSVRLWDIPTRRVVATLRGPGRPNRMQSVRFSPDGRMLAAASGLLGPGEVALWDVASRRKLPALRDRRSGISALAFSPKGKLLATGRVDGMVRLWDLTARRAIATLHGHEYSVRSVAFSPDGQTLATGGEDNTVKLWDVSHRRLASMATLKGHAGTVTTLAFSPDGRTLASGGYDLAVKLWNMKMRQEVAELRGQRGPISSVAFSPDGQILASASQDGTVRLWRAGP